MKPKKLAKDWIVVTSKSHPNRVYYFNVRSNKSSWEVPTDDFDEVPNMKKRKANAIDEDEKPRPTTPELEATDPPKGSERQMLRAKRSVQPAKPKNAPAPSTSASTSNETPQMRQLREKMLARQAKGNVSKRSKVVAPKTTLKKEEATTPEKTPTLNILTDAETKYLTPQMKSLVAKIRERKSKTKSPKTPAPSQEIEEIPKTTPLRRPRARSIASTDLPINDSAKTTRRTSRRTIHASASSSETKSTNITAADVSSSDVSSTVPTVVSRRRNSTRELPTTSPKKALTTVAKNVSITPDIAKIPRFGRSAQRKKNLAEERLLNLRNSLDNEKSIVESTSSPDREICENDGNIASSAILINRIDDQESPPSIHKNAATRMKFLRERLRNKTMYEKKSRPTTNEDDCSIAIADGTVNDDHNESDNFYEEMEWEPIEDHKIMQEIEVVRSYINAMDDEPMAQEIPQNSLDLPDGPSAIKPKSLYIVIDTNVFLSNLNAIEETRDTVFRTYGRPVIVVPWTVIRELDFIKDDKSMTRPEFLRAKARQAVRFLHQHFSARHPRVLGQTPMDVANNRVKFEIECPDDEILQTCLQIRLSNNCVVLLSYDKNLCNKAMIHDVVTLGRHDPLEKIDYLHAGDVTDESLFAQHLRGEERDSRVVPIYVKELRIAEDIMNDAKDILTSFLSVIVAKEMQKLYSKNWEKYTLIRPPWSVHAVLTCALKHWIAAVSESLTKRGEWLLKSLKDAMNKSEKSGQSLTDVSHILELINDLLQCTKGDRYIDIVVRASTALSQLRAKCLEATQKLRTEQLQESIGDPKNEDKVRADVAFQQFEQVYAFARDMCGLASEAIGLPCSFPFKKLNPLPTVETLKVLQPDIAANLNRLLQVLSTALEELNSLHVDHRAVLALYNALSTFMPDQKGQTAPDLSPLDVYWCLKIKEKMLRSGLGQLQELSSHFCRMASFRCTISV